ncbi:uncharacterized protein LOC124897813 [Capsicum annuum]|uniref:uncharacterized protein LOC124897813 n=1 Tax=Capsicum annuum TaxID=4072 RepID=UPI001FB0E072|nr:uncharacterized protein LOC124897813 [Capsicum annuum]
MPSSEKIFKGRYFNGHIRSFLLGYDDMYEGFGFGVRNDEGAALLDFLRARWKGDRALCKGCKEFLSENLATQHRLLVMDLVIKKGKKRRGRKGRPRVRTTGYIKESAGEVLGVSKGWSCRCWGDWWWNEDVKKEVETKQTASTKLIKSKDEKEKRVSKEEYKLSKKDAKLAVTAAKTATFKSLYKGLEEKDEEKKLFTLAKIKEVSEAIRKMRRGRATGPDEILVYFWKFSSEAGFRWLTSLFNNIFKSKKMLKV